MHKCIFESKGKREAYYMSSFGDGDNKYDDWRRDDTRIMTWLYNSMKPQKTPTKCFLNNKRDLGHSEDDVFSEKK